MPMVPLRNMGGVGFVIDTPPGSTPPQAWSLVRNVVFKGPYISRRKEPEPVEPPLPISDAIWADQFFDGTIVRAVVASRSNIYLLSADGGNWADVTRESGPYTTPVDGYWQSFRWGNTVVFNNGVDIPQVYDPTTAKFIDMPRWGLVSDQNGDPGFDTGLRCRVLVPYRNFLVALNCEWSDPLGEQYLEDRNRVWWSDPFETPKLWEVPSNYPWDYSDPTTLSGQNLVGMESGPLQWAEPLGGDLVIYNSLASTRMQLVGNVDSPFIFEDLLPYGCVGVYGAVEFNNQHYVVSADSHYIHDGNTVVQIAEDRVRDWFFDAVKNLDSTVRLMVDTASREVMIQFDAKPDPTLLPPGHPDPTRLALVYNYEDNNYSVIDAFADENGVAGLVKCMVAGLDLQRSSLIGGVWDDAVGVWDEQAQSWNSLAGSTTASTVRTSTFWLTPGALYRADTLGSTTPLKSYLVQKLNMNLDELFQEATSNFWLHISQMYPHMRGVGTMRVRAGWSPDLESNPTWGPYKDYFLGDAITPADYKIDFRQTGRYLALEMRFDEITDMKLSGADVDLKLTYGR